MKKKNLTVQPYTLFQNLLQILRLNHLTNWNKTEVNI